MHLGARGSLFAAMRWLDKIENRLGWLQFPGLPKYIAFLGALAYVSQWIRPDIATLLDFNRAKFFQGEVWRLFTYPVAEWGARSFTSTGMLFLIFAIFIAVLISDSLEEIWGSTRTTLYVLLGWVGMSVSHLVFNPATQVSGMLLGTSLFLAFATLFPRYEFRLFFVLPIQVRFLGWLSVAGLVLMAVGDPRSLLLIAPALLPYFLWVLPSIARDRAALAASAGRRREFAAAQKPEDPSFHRCEACGRTEQDDRDLEFFTLPDGKEFCKEHLPPGF